MKIVQFGLRFSPNVGDGIIAECLAHGLRQRRPGTEVVTIDLSGRQDFGNVTVANRSLALAILARLPLRVRQLLVERMLGRKLGRVEPAWKAAIEGADLAVIGGGQLFSDADLNFCVKISRAAGLISAAGVASAVFAVGVSRNWTPRGRELFLRLAETDLRLVGTRDPRSAEAWRAQVPTGLMPDPELTPDPGLLAADVYGPPATRHDRVGVCVTSPAILAYHAESGTPGIGGSSFFVGLVTHLVARGRRVELFCNGAEEDRATLHGLAGNPAIREMMSRAAVTIAPPPETPTELARIASRCSAVVAHRLHACVVAYSYGVPIVGLGWDRKVESFFETVEAGRYFLDAGAICPRAAADRVEEALAAGIDPAIHARIIATAWRGLDRLLEVAD